MPRVMRFGVLAVGVLLLSGCAKINMTALNVDKAVFMSGKPTEKPYDVVRHFSQETKGMYLAFDLATIREPEVEKILNQELKAADGDAVINLQLKHQFSFVDGLIRVLTEPLFGTSTVTVEGDIIKYHKQ